MYTHWLRVRHTGLAAESDEDGHLGWRTSQGSYHTSFASRFAILGIFAKPRIKNKYFIVLLAHHSMRD